MIFFVSTWFFFFRHSQINIGTYEVKKVQQKQRIIVKRSRAHLIYMIEKCINEKQLGFRCYAYGFHQFFFINLSFWFGYVI
jgi:hypothetical protein